MNSGILFWCVYFGGAVLMFFLLLIHEKRTDQLSRFGVVICTFLTLIWPITLLLICIFFPVLKIADLLAGIYSRIVERDDI